MRKVIISILALSILALSILYFVWHGKGIPNRDSEILSSGNTKNARTDYVHNAETAKQRRIALQRARLAILNQNMRRLVESDDANQAEDQYAVTDEEIERFSVLAIRDAAIGDDYQAEAPQALQELFDEEAEDYLWTQQLESALTERIETFSESAPELIDVSCHGTMCKIVTQHQKLETIEKLLGWQAHSLPMRGAGIRYTEETSEGELRSIFFMGKDSSAFQDSVRNRIYENITGRSAHSIKPTTADITHIAEMFERLSHESIDNASEFEVANM